MKTILAAMCAILVGVTYAGSPAAADQKPEEMVVAMGSLRNICGGNTGRPCPGQPPVVVPPVMPPSATAPPVTAAVDFSLANGGNMTLPPSSTGATVITAARLGGVAQSISLSVSGVPSGVTASFSQGSCAPSCSSLLKVTTSSLASIGSAAITVTAVAGA